MSSTHLTEPPAPRRRAFTVACSYCQDPVAASHDTVRAVCPSCVAARLGKPGPLLPRIESRQLELAGGAAR